MLYAPPPEAPPSIVTRFGTAVGAGAIASLVASVPAALRVAHDADSRFGPLGVWLALAAASLVPTTLAVGVLRGTRRGLAAFGGEGTGARALALIPWGLASTFVLLVLAAGLRATTHHHALAGATFGLFGLAIVLALALAAVRVASITAKWPPAVVLVVMGGAVALLGILLLYFSVRVARVSPSTVALVVDVLAYVIAAGFMSRAPLAGNRVFAIVGPPLSTLLFVFGLSSLKGAPAVPAAVHARAPLLVGPVDCTAQLIRKR